MKVPYWNWIAGGLYILTLLLGCTPTLNWRTVTLPSSGTTMLWPCKPDHFSKSFTVMGESVEMALSTCAAGQMTFAVTAVAVHEDHQIPVVIDALRATLRERFNQVIDRPTGDMGPQATLMRHSVARAEKSGTAATIQADWRVSTKGRLILQHVVMGEQLDAEAVDVFSSNIKQP